MLPVLPESAVPFQLSRGTGPQRRSDRRITMNSLVSRRRLALPPRLRSRQRTGPLPYLLLLGLAVMLLAAGPAPMTWAGPQQSNKRASHHASNHATKRKAKTKKKAVAPKPAAKPAVQPPDDNSPQVAVAAEPPA